MIKRKARGVISIIIIFTIVKILFLYSYVDNGHLLTQIVGAPYEHIYRSEQPSDSEHTSHILKIIDPENLSPEEINLVSANVAELNLKQKILNDELFAPLTVDSFVIVIQVHTRTDYLKPVIESLSRARLIETALVVFSHDVFMPELNELIQAINFTRVLQIYYPHSIQLHPNKFPGQSPDECPQDWSSEKALKFNCNNASDPEIRKRNAAVTQVKHHWWWKLNFVFKNITILQNYAGVVTFIEEDDYMAPDFLWTIDLMRKKMTENLCSGCDIFSLGTHSDLSWHQGSAFDAGVVTRWNHNLGMTFNSTVWNTLEACANLFCKYNDYNWDWTLRKVSGNCLKSPLRVLYPSTTRIFHIGACGVHYKNSDCSPDPAINIIKNGIEEYKLSQFPQSITLRVFDTGPDSNFPENGSWKDIRDVELCLSF